MSAHKIPGSKTSTVEMPPTGKRKTGTKVSFTDSPSPENAAALTASGALVDQLTQESAATVLAACCVEDDHVEEILELVTSDPLTAIAMASAVRTAIVARQSKTMKAMLGDFGDTGN